MHQYLVRGDNTVVTEQLFGDRIVNFLYSHVREHAPSLFHMVTTPRMSHLLGIWNFDIKLGARLLGNRKFLNQCGVNLDECVDDISSFTNARKIFERKIKYWDCRPMDTESGSIVSPADSRVIVGALSEHTALFIKDKFFQFEELLGSDKDHWLQRFSEGDYAVCRLTPDKYHHNHTPVAGRVEDFYTVAGVYHSCNPGAVIEIATPYSKNKRIVTIINTDVDGGTGVGLVAMIEVTALMIGDVVQCYSAEKYHRPQNITKGMFLKKGQPKSLYRPGSSTDILLFEKGRVRFSPDLVNSRQRTDIHSRFSKKFGYPLVEVDVNVRSKIADKK
ncbi:MAG TPA: phosphatidylserine decarboxylase [Desulfocapsa sulfexigens]|nr:phosphatidylserine decarboxylase [Desulfocapsa sulfexigens]